jgi:hypothetical protein
MGADGGCTEAQGLRGDGGVRDQGAEASCHQLWWIETVGTVNKLD